MVIIHFISITFTVNLNISEDHRIITITPTVIMFVSLLFIEINFILIRYVVPDTPGQQHSLLAGLDVNPLEGWDPAKVG